MEKSKLWSFLERNLKDYNTDTRIARVNTIESMIENRLPEKVFEEYINLVDDLFAEAVEGSFSTPKFVSSNGEEANQFVVEAITPTDKNWVAVVSFNGEISSETQKEMASKMIMSL
jgi:hypothetical protein